MPTPTPLKRGTESVGFSPIPNTQSTNPMRPRPISRRPESSSSYASAIRPRPISRRVERSSSDEEVASEQSSDEEVALEQSSVEKLQEIQELIAELPYTITKQEPFPSSFTETQAKLEALYLSVNSEEQKLLENLTALEKLKLELAISETITKQQEEDVLTLLEELNYISLDEDALSDQDVSSDEDALSDQDVSSDEDELSAQGSNEDLSLNSGEPSDEDALSVQESDQDVSSDEDELSAQGSNEDLSLNRGEPSDEDALSVQESDQDEPSDEDALSVQQPNEDACKIIACILEKLSKLMRLWADNSSIESPIEKIDSKRLNEAIAKLHPTKKRLLSEEALEKVKESLSTENVKAALFCYQFLSAENQQELHELVNEIPEFFHQYFQAHYDTSYLIPSTKCITNTDHEKQSSDVTFPRPTDFLSAEKRKEIIDWILNAEEAQQVEAQPQTSAISKKTEKSSVPSENKPVDVKKQITQAVTTLDTKTVQKILKDPQNNEQRNDLVKQMLQQGFGLTRDSHLKGHSRDPFWDRDVFGEQKRHVEMTIWLIQEAQKILPEELLGKMERSYQHVLESSKLEVHQQLNVLALQININQRIKQCSSTDLHDKLHDVLQEIVECDANLSLHLKKRTIELLCEIHKNNTSPSGMESLIARSNTNPKQMKTLLKSMEQAYKLAHKNKFRIYALQQALIQNNAATLDAILEVPFLTHRDATELKKENPQHTKALLTNALKLALTQNNETDLDVILKVPFLTYEDATELEKENPQHTKFLRTNALKLALTQNNKATLDAILEVPFLTFRDATDLADKNKQHTKALLTNAINCAENKLKELEQSISTKSNLGFDLDPIEIEVAQDAVKKEKNKKKTTEGILEKLNLKLNQYEIEQKTKRKVPLSPQKPNKNAQSKRPKPHKRQKLHQNQDHSEAAKTFLDAIVS